MYAAAAAALPGIVLTLVISFGNPIHEPWLELTELLQECQWVLEYGRRSTLANEPFVVFRHCRDPSFGCHLVRDPLELCMHVHKQVEFITFLYNQRPCIDICGE